MTFINYSKIYTRRLAMCIEEKIFQRKNFIPQLMLEHGFIKTPSGFT